MSNGDDVLDNWEEIDEAGITNKLHKIQAERKSFEQHQQQLLKTPALSTASTAPAVNSTISSFPHPMKLLQRTQSQDTTVKTSSSSVLKSPLDDMSASFQPVMMVLHQPVDEYQSANYTQPISSQTVKILRRPTQSSEPRNNGMRPRQPIKTLQQREQEYAEARLRILGSAKNPEDDATNSGTPSNNATTASLTTATTATKVNFSPKTPVTQNSSYSNNQQQQTPATAYNNSNSYTNYNNQRSVLALPQQQEQLQQQQQQTWSPIVGGNVSSSSLVRQQQQESIVRLPRGPDGSTGFQVRR